MGTIKYVSLEPGAFLSDIDFQAMSAEQRGVYISIILYLYTNNGKLKNDLELLSKMCNINGEFDYQPVLSKFQIRRGFITHKRVDEELARAQTRHDAAVTAAKARWNSNADAMQPHSEGNADAMPSEVKGSEVKRSEDKDKEHFNISQQKYYGTKRGLDEEFLNFCKHADWRTVLPLLAPAIDRQIKWRSMTKEFVPPPKNFKTWINQRCWTEEHIDAPDKVIDQQKRQQQAAVLKKQDKDRRDFTVKLTEIYKAEGKEGLRKFAKDWPNLIWLCKEVMEKAGD